MSYIIAFGTRLRVHFISSKNETPGIVCLDIEERRKRMPTINQLVRQGRTDKTTKSKSPALNRGYNSLAKNQQLLIHLKNVVFVHVLLL